MVDISNNSMRVIERILDTKLEHLNTKLEAKIDELNVQLSESKSEIRVLKRQLAERDEAIAGIADRLNDVEVRLDDQEQYGRRFAVRIEGLEYKPNETNADIHHQVVTKLAELDVHVKDRDIVCLHWSSKPVGRRGKPVAQTIVKF